MTVQFEGTLNGCNISRQCRQSFDVHKWQTSTINRTAAANTANYVRVGRVSPAVTDGDEDFVDSLDIELNDDEDGFYLAVVDLGTCVTLTRILVLYYVCPEETSELISRPEAIDSESIEGTPSVEGECVENSSTGSGADPLLICGAGGQWQVIVPCLCNPGYQLESSQDQCSCMYLSCVRLIPAVCIVTTTILQSVQMEPSHQKWVMDHIRHVQLTVRGLELV